MEEILHTLLERYPALADSAEDIRSAYSLLEQCYEGGGCLFIAGNGGSAADANHMVGELMKSFVLKRPLSKALKEELTHIDCELGSELAECLEGSLRAISLTEHVSLSTAYANDRLPHAAFAQALYGYARKGDVFLGISTSGNSKNIICAAITAQAVGLPVIALTGKHESRLSRLASCAIRVPETETYKIQELHLPVYHSLCLMLEKRFFAPTVDNT